MTEEEIDGRGVLEVRNKIYSGEILEVLSPDGSLSQTTLDDPLVTTDKRSVDFANNSQFVLLSEKLPVYSILRRVLRDE